MVIDGFISSYGDLREYANTAKFETEVNPVDGVEYPHICKEIPQAIRSEIIIKLSKAVGKMINVGAMFMRMSPEGVNVPHMAHTDNSMGAYSCMLYMNDNDFAGTSLLRHRETGISYAPESDKYLGPVLKDQNNVSAWVKIAGVTMKQNRAFIFDAGNFHCAEPVGGFGDTQENSRLVLTVFFT